MEKTILYPSPNWFQCSGIAVSSDEWVFYGGPTKSLCVLVPIPVESNPENEEEEGGYHAHVVVKAHPEKIVSVDVSPEWPNKRAIITGSSDGLVKQWSLNYEHKNLTIKTTNFHEMHSSEKEEIAGVGYSNEVYAITVGSYGNVIKWDINSNVAKIYNSFTKNFKPICMKCSPHIALNVAIGTKQGIIFVLDLNDAGKLLYKVRGHDDEIINIDWCPQFEVEVRKAIKESVDSRMSKIRAKADSEENLEDSLVSANKQDTSELDDLQTSINKQDTSQCNDTEIVEEDDLFDKYKDHEANEFGHKKYQPEDIVIRVKTDENVETNYLAECLKLKGDILKRKEDNEVSIEKLVDSLDKTHIDEQEKDADTKNENEVKETENTVPFSVHIHRHLLASIGKQGSVRIWSKTGKQVASCLLPYINPKLRMAKGIGGVTLLWYKHDMLLMADNKCQLLKTNPLKLDAKNHLEWQVVHKLHKRPLFCLAAARGAGGVWSASQDRALVRYSPARGRALAVNSTCGGFVYAVTGCPYDPNKVAISVGDGAVRVLAGVGAAAGDAAVFWQGVQGKVLALAWHPTHENMLAFATAEARIGVLDVGGRSEKPARVLSSMFNQAVYGLSWGADGALYACGGGDLVRYASFKHDSPGEVVPVRLEGAAWRVCEVVWTPRALCVGSADGAVGLLTAAAPHAVRAAAFPFTKMIHCIDWHPQQVSESNEESPNKNLIVASSIEKHFVILGLIEFEDGSMKLSVLKTLIGHSGSVNRVLWNPHKENIILSTSQDGTVRIWCGARGECTHVCGGAGGAWPSLGAAWAGDPALASCALVGSADCALRLWDYTAHPTHLYKESTYTGKKDKKKKNRPKVTSEVSVRQDSDEEGVATVVDKNKIKASKKFLYPVVYRQMLSENLNACRKLLKKYVEKLEKDKNCGEKEVKNADGKEKKIGDEKEVKNANEKEEKIAEEKEVKNANEKEEKNSDGKEVKNGYEKTEENDHDIKEEDNDDAGEKNLDDIDTDYIKMFGSINEVNELLDMEQKRHEALGNHESWIMLALFRGRIDDMYQYAAKRDMICPFLLSVAPCVSYKYWKDASQQYISQLDRLHAKGDEEKIFESRRYGGYAHRKAALQLGVHDVRGAVHTLRAARLTREAFLLARARHADSLARDLLPDWARRLRDDAVLPAAAAVFIAIDDLPQAATTLGKSRKEEYLSLAAEIAKISGQKTYATHIEEVMKAEQVQSTETELEELPTKIALLMSKMADTNQNGCDDASQNGVHSVSNGDKVE